MTKADALSARVDAAALCGPWHTRPMFEPSPEIEAVVRRYLAARDQGDVETLNNLHSFSDDLRVIGSDEHEWYSGHDNVVAIQKLHLEEQPRTVTDLIRLEAFSNGNTGWAALDMEVSFAKGDTFRARQSIVLVIESGIWRIAQVHWSIPVSNEVVDGVELTRTLSDLLVSMDSSDPSSDHDPGDSHTVTVMFTDIIESEIETGSPEDRRRAETLTAYFGTARKIVEANGGSVVRTLGNGGMYVFPTGAAALSAAISMQRAAKDSLGESAMSIGVHTGDVVQRRSQYVGPTVAKAAGVAAAAEGGQVMVSKSTAGMVNASDFTFGGQVNVELEGIPGQHVLVPLISA